MPYQVETLKDKKILITGSSSGIGHATASLLGHEAKELFLVARREDRLQELRENLLKSSPKLKINVLVGSLTDPAFISKMKSSGFFEVEVLINNAGLALGRDEVAKSDISDWEQMIATNITAAFRMVREVLPYMQKNGGDIVNIASVAGREAYALGAVYCATKHALLAFAESLRKETYGQDIRVMNLSPGMVETEFSEVRFKGDQTQAKSVYQGMKPQSSQDMAQHILYMLTRPRHVCIDELFSMATDQGSATLVRRNSP